MGSAEFWLAVRVWVGVYIGVCVRVGLGRCYGMDPDGVGVGVEWGWSWSWSRMGLKLGLEGFIRRVGSISCQTT